MSQYPVDTTDNLVEAVNYLLSGPTSIGQNFQGMNAFGDPGLPYPGSGTGSYYTNGIIPGGFPTVPNSQVRDSNTDRYASLSDTGQPATITNITATDPTGKILTVDYTLGALFDGINNSLRPFAQGQIITIEGVTPSDFNGVYEILEPFLPAGSITVAAIEAKTWPAYSTGGDITWNYSQSRITTDCNAIVQVTGPTDHVFVTSQDSTVFGLYDSVGYAGTLPVLINSQINRYVAVGTTTLPNSLLSADGSRYYNGYIWRFDKTILDIPSYIPYTMSSGPATHDMGTNIFANLIDVPNIGYYWYALEYDFKTPESFLYPVYLQTKNFRSFTAQVIKQ